MTTLHNLPNKCNCSLKLTTKGEDNFQRKEEKALELSLETAIICLRSGKHGILGKFSCYLTQSNRKSEMIDKIKHVSF